MIESYEEINIPNNTVDNAKLLIKYLGSEVLIKNKVEENSPFFKLNGKYILGIIMQVNHPNDYILKTDNIKHKFRTSSLEGLMVKSKEDFDQEIIKAIKEGYRFEP